MNISTICFFCVIEGDLMIFSSISKLIKTNNSILNIKLIVPSHPRIANNIVEKYTSYFDEVIRLPQVNISKNIIRSIKEIIDYRKELKKINTETVSFVFIFDLYKLSEILFYSYIRKLQKKKINFPKLVTITPYLSNPFKNKRAKLLLYESIIASFYSFFFANGKIIRRYKIRGTKLTGFLKFSQKVDYQLNLENSSHRTIAGKVIKNLSYPVPLLDTNEKFDLFDASKPSIFVLVSTLHGNINPHYWAVMQEFFNAINQYANNFNILIKDHPGTESKLFRYVKKLESYYLLDSKISAEVFYLNEKLNVKYVFGYGSTAILTASWMGIKSFDYTHMLNYNNFMLDYYDDFLRLGNDITQLKSIKELQKIHISNYKIDFEERKKIITEGWLKTLKTLGIL